MFRALLAAALLALAAPAARADLPRFSPEGLPEPSLGEWLPRGGDPFGQRRALAERGLFFNLWYRQDVLGNVSGGLRRGFITQLLFEPSFLVDFEKLAGLPGLTAFSNVFVIGNTGRIRRDYVGGINTIAAIEAVPGVRLSEAWLEQRFWDGRAGLRAGQIVADVEFFFSEIGTMFLQADFPTITAVNLPGGGPAYPLSTPGARLRVEPRADLTFLAAVFNGNPSGPGARDEQLLNRNGLNFRTRDPALLMGEMQWRRNAGDEEPGLATRLKLGGWAQLGRFDDKRLDSAGGLLADPGGTGAALRRQGTWGVYAVLDQQLWRPAGADAQGGINFFGRIAGAPQDRSLVSFYFDTGLVFANLVPGRPQDRFGFSLLYAQFSNGARAFARDASRLTGVALNVPNFEMNLELSYVAEIRPGLNLQPMFTYVWNPAGERGRHAAVTGFRTFLRF
jgi:porin